MVLEIGMDEGNVTLTMRGGNEYSNGAKGACMEMSPEQARAYAKLLTQAADGATTVIPRPSDTDT